MVVTALLAAAPAGGGYINPIKLIVALVLLFVWLRLLNWADKDAPVSHLPRESLNSAFVAGLALAFGLFFLVPNFLLGLLAIFCVFGIEVGVYLYLRHQKVGLKDLKGELQGAFKGKGKSKVVAEVVGDVQIVTKAGLLPGPTEDSPDVAAYQGIQSLFADPLRRNAEQMDLLPTEDGLGVRYVVDGFPYRGNSIDRGVGAEVITYIKRYAGMDINDKRKPQTGNIKLSIVGQKRELQVRTRGTTAGEQMSMSADQKTRHTLKLDQLGLSPEQAELLADTIHGNAGIVLVSAPKGGGLTSLMYAILRAHDAFLTHIHTIEREPDTDLEGITQNKLSSAASAGDESKQVRWVIDQAPDTIAMTSIEDQASAKELIRFAKEGKRVYIGLRAGSTQDALTQWIKLVGDANLALDQVVLAISGRVMRKLCNACKVGYTPDPVTLRKLNMDPDRVSRLYQARTEPMRDPKGNPILCEFCNELRFKGRVGVYEIFVVDDDAKKATLAGIADPRAMATQLKMAFRKQRARYLQEQALLVVEKGDTSVQEVLRVLKADTGSPPPANSTRSSAPARPA